MPNDRFLLIKGLSHSFWENVHLTVEMLLATELTGRIPVIHWGTTTCQHNGVVYNNAFDMYFEPVTAYSIALISRSDYTYDPPTWTDDNLAMDDANRFTLKYRNAGQIMGSTANVVVSDMCIPIKQFIPWIKKGHSAYGMSPDQIYRYLFRKYLRLKPDIENEIHAFYESRLKSDKPVMAVHLPGQLATDIYPQIQKFNRLYYPESFQLPRQPRRYVQRKRTDKFRVDENAHLHEIVRLLKVNQAGDPYQLYHPEIRNMIGKFTISKLFLITDREEIVEHFSQTYSHMLVYHDSERIGKHAAELQLLYPVTHLDTRSKGVEAIKDAYLASKCDFFIGYGGSDLSHAVSRLKNWPETNLKLTYWMFPKLYNFTYEMVKTGRYAPKEADGKYRLLMKRAGNWIRRIRQNFALTR